MRDKIRLYTLSNFTEANTTEGSNTCSVIFLASNGIKLNTTVSFSHFLNNFDYVLTDSLSAIPYGRRRGRAMHLESVNFKMPKVSSAQILAKKRFKLSVLLPFKAGGIDPETWPDSWRKMYTQMVEVRFTLVSSVVLPLFHSFRV
jgi:hypothetical protein